MGWHLRTLLFFASLAQLFPDMLPSHLFSWLGNAEAKKETYCGCVEVIRGALRGKCTLSSRFSRPRARFGQVVTIRAPDPSTSGRVCRPNDRDKPR